MEIHPAKTPRLRTRVLQNTAALLGGRGISIVLSAGASVLLTRYLGSERLGQFGAIYAYLGLFTWLTTLGIEPVLVREISKERESASSLLHTAIILASFLSVGALFATILLAPWAGFNGHLRTLLILAAFEFVLIPVRLPGMIFQVDLRQWYAATINVVRQGVWFGIVIILWVLGASLFYVVLGRLLATAVESALTWAYSREFLSATKKFLRERSAKILLQSIPIAFTTLLSMVYFRIDQVMLHKLASDFVLGQYVAAVRVSELFEFLPAAFIVSMAPILSVSVDEPQRFQEYTGKLFRYFMIAASAICVFMSAGAGLIVRVLYGKQFLTAGPLLAVLIWSEVAVFFATVVYNVLIAKNQQWLLPVPTLVGAAVNIALNLILIPRYGAAGAAWATLVSYTVAWIVVLFFFEETRPLILQGMRFALPITGFGLFAVTCALFVSAHDIIRILTACILFGLSLWLSRFIKRSDMTDVLAFIRSSLGNS
ncbi:MAG TPA: flippase [Candidatus Acidoferrales bacterium]